MTSFLAWLRGHSRTPIPDTIPVPAENKRAVRLSGDDWDGRDWPAYFGILSFHGKVSLADLAQAARRADEHERLTTI